MVSCSKTCANSGEPRFPIYPKMLNSHRDKCQIDSLRDMVSSIFFEHSLGTPGKPLGFSNSVLFSRFRVR